MTRPTKACTWVKKKIYCTLQRIFYRFLDPPSIVSGPINQTVNETRDLRLSCNATGNLQPLITWSKGLVRIGVPSADGVVIVTNVNKSDSGVYQCSASNGIGRDAKASSTVTVNCKLHVTIKTTTRQATFVCY